MLQKRMLALSMFMAALLLISCGKSESVPEEAAVNLVGSLSDIMATVYENADLSQEFRDSLALQYDSGNLADLPVETVDYLIGTPDVEYEEGVYSLPLMNVIPYQFLLLRMPQGADIEAAKQSILDNADTRKWICVEAENVVVENVGDVILFVMGDTDSTNALRTAFLELGA